MKITITALCIVGIVCIALVADAESKTDAEREKLGLGKKDQTVNYVSRDSYVKREIFYYEIRKC